MALTRSTRNKGSIQQGSIPQPSTPDDSEDTPYTSATPSEEQQPQPQAHHGVDKISIGGIFFKAWCLSCFVVLVLCIAGVHIAYDANLANPHANSSQKVPPQMSTDTLPALPLPEWCQQETTHILLDSRDDMTYGEGYTETRVDNPNLFNAIPGINAQCVHDHVMESVRDLAQYNQSYWDACKLEGRAACSGRAHSLECYKSRKGQLCLNEYSKFEFGTLINVVASRAVWKNCNDPAAMNGRNLSNVKAFFANTELESPMFMVNELLPDQPMFLLKDDARILHLAKILSQDTEFASTRREYLAAFVAKQNPPDKAKKPRVANCMCGTTPQCVTVAEPVDPKIHYHGNSAQRAIRLNSASWWNRASANLARMRMPPIPKSETRSCQATPALSKFITRSARCA